MLKEHKQWQQIVYFGFVGPKPLIKILVEELLNGKTSRDTSLTILEYCPDIDVKKHNRGNLIDLKMNGIVYKDVLIVAVQVASIGIVLTCCYKEQSLY